MSKELTDKWKNGDLSDDGLYYWRISDGQELIKNKLEMYAYRLCSDAEKIECLAPVPSYEEYKRLQEQIKEANEIIISFDKLVGKLIGTVFQNVLDYYKKYNVDRYKKSGV